MTDTIGDFRTNIDGCHAIGLDIETCDPELKKLGSGVRRKDTYVAGFSIAACDEEYQPFWSSYFPLRHQGGGNLPDPETALRYLQDRIYGAREIIGANLIYDIEYLIVKHAIDFEIMKVGRRNYVDVQVAEPLIDENKRGEYSLDHLARHYGFGGKVDEGLYTYLAENFKGQPTREAQAGRIHLAPGHIVAPYANGDTELPCLIYGKQRKILRGEEPDARGRKHRLGAVWLLERDLFPMLLAMKLRGVRIDTEQAIENEKLMQGDLHAKLSKLEKLGIAPDANISIAQYCEAVGVEYPLTPTGLPQFQKDWLKSHSDPVLNQVAEVRRLSKSTGTFIQGILKHTTDAGRIHCQFNQLKSDKNGTVSGRFSSSNPNLQNQPARDEEMMPLVRGLFIPDPDEDWGSADYSQIEYRLLIIEAIKRLALRKKNGELFPDAMQPPSFLSAVRMRDRFIEGKRTGEKVDVHEETGKLCDINRKDGKNINFGMVYGLGLESLIARLDKVRAECIEIIEKYHSGAPYAKEMYNLMQKLAKAGNDVVTIGGRHRRYSKLELNVPWQWRGKGEPPYPFSAYMKEKDGKWVRNRAKSARPPVFSNFDAALDYYVTKGEGAEPEVSERDFVYAFCHTALNALLQGGAADIMKRAMLDIWNAGICDVLGAPLLTVHDELNWSIPRTTEAREAFEESVRLMEAVYADRITMPLEVEYQTGANWAVCK